MSKVYESKVEVLDNGDGLLDLPEEMVKELGWQIGDALDFNLENGGVVIRNLSHDLRDKGATVFSDVAKFMIAAGQTVVSHNPVQAALYEKLKISGI